MSPTFVDTLGEEAGNYLEVVPAPHRGAAPLVHLLTGLIAIKLRSLSQNQQVGAKTTLKRTDAMHEGFYASCEVDRVASEAILIDGVSDFWRESEKDAAGFFNHGVGRSRRGHHQVEREVWGLQATSIVELVWAENRRRDTYK